MDYDGSSEGGPKGSFENFKAEGEVLFKHHEYKKALESFNTALEIRPGDIPCLIARSHCYLQLGDSEKALADADEVLKENKNSIKGLLLKAESYYQMGQFEYALMFYHRGHKLRPEVQDFRKGIQKAQEAIDNSIGNTAGIELKNEGDLTYFYEEQQKGKQKGKGTYGRPAVKKDDKKDQKRQKPTTDKKTLKQLLGELYSDKEYLEKLLEETEANTNKSDINESVKDLAENCLKYLDSRTQFWQQQKPMYARKHEQKKKENARKRVSSGAQKDPTEWILKNLEEIDAAQADGKHEQALKQAKKVLKEVEKWSDDDVQNRPEVVSNIHSCIGNSYLEMGEYQKSLEHHTVDHEISTQKDLEDGKSRALDNLGRVYARMGKFEKAIEVWEDKLPMSKSALESTWLYHEIGRCQLETGKYEEAQNYGEKSLKAAEEAADDVWQLNATVLIAQTQVKLGENNEALDTFEKAQGMASKQGDKAAESAIKKAIDDVNSKIVKGEKEGGASAEKPKKMRKKLTPEERQKREEEKRLKAEKKAEIERLAREKIEKEEAERRLAEEEEAERQRIEAEKAAELLVEEVYPTPTFIAQGVQTEESRVHEANLVISQEAKKDTLKEQNTPRTGKQNSKQSNPVASSKSQKMKQQDDHLLQPDKKSTSKGQNTPRTGKQNSKQQNTEASNKTQKTKQQDNHLIQPDKKNTSKDQNTLRNMKENSRQPNTEASSKPKRQSKSPRADKTRDGMEENAPWR